MLPSPGRRGALMVVQLAAVEAKEDEVPEAVVEMRPRCGFSPACACAAAPRSSSRYSMQVRSVVLQVDERGALRVQAHPG